MLKKNTLFIVAILLITSTINAQIDTVYIMKSGNVVNKQSIKKTDVDSIKFYHLDTLSFVKNKLIVNKQSIKFADVDSVIFYKPTIGNLTTVIDFDGNVYNTVTIGTQVWMAENLKTTKYNDGTAIPNVTGATAWCTHTTGAYCDYNNTQGNSNTYGKLYNYYTVVDAHKLCPTGWHVPSDTEWTTLTDYLGGENVAGGKLKEIGTTHWTTPNSAADNTTGFTALPGGYRSYDVRFSFGSVGDFGYWWSAADSYVASVYCRSIYYLDSFLFRSGADKENGFSVRCVRD
jgi:uncharacterized protein (TIGR02145 family)